MTEPEKKWPPSPEEIESLAVNVDNALLPVFARQDDGSDLDFSVRMEAERLIEILRDPRLRAALDLADAVAWIEENAMMMNDIAGSAHIAWRVTDPDTEHEGEARTIVEAVTALRAKLSGKEGDRG